jgi:hypothetical protein
LEVYFYASVPKITQTSDIIGKFIAAKTAKTDIIFTNFEPGQHPYKSSDVMCERATRNVADRQICFQIQSLAQISEKLALFKTTNANAIFVRDVSLPVSKDLLQRLEQIKPVASDQIMIPEERLFFIISCIKLATVLCGETRPTVSWRFIN